MNTNKRPILIVIPKWPDGTMAFKFGSVMRSVLKVSKDELKLIQFEPERIFRTTTDVSEAEFNHETRTKLGTYIHTFFVELDNPQH